MIMILLIFHNGVDDGGDDMGDDGVDDDLDAHHDDGDFVDHDIDDVDDDVVDFDGALDDHCVHGDISDDRVSENVAGDVVGGGFGCLGRDCVRDDDAGDGVAMMALLIARLMMAMKLMMSVVSAVMLMRVIESTTMMAMKHMIWMRIMSLMMTL